MIDLRKHFDEFLRDYGHYVLLQRTSRKIRCRCWDERHKEASPDCRICLGKGWISRIERHRTRYDTAIQVVSRPNLNQLTPVGRNWVDARAFYFAHDVHPKVGDMIFEVGWHPYNPHKPTHLIRAYVINDVYPFRGDRGRIEYYMTSVKAETLQHKVRNIVVRSLGPVKNYEFIFE